MRAILFGLLALFTALPASAQEAYRIESSEEAFVLSLPPGAQARLSEGPKGPELELSGAAIGPERLELQDDLVSSLSIDKTPTGARLRLQCRSWSPARLETPEGGVRLVLPKRFHEVSREPLGAGVWHEHHRQADKLGPLSWHVLKVDPRAGARLAPALAGGFYGRAPVSAIARQSGALAALNGAYFSPRTGEPLGLLVIDRQIVSGPLMNRSALVIREDGTAFVDRAQVAARLELPGGESADLDGVNQSRGQNRMVLYTGAYGPRAPRQEGGKDFSLAPDGTVAGVYDTEAPILPGGAVISAHGQCASWLERALGTGGRASIKTTLSELWPGMRHALGGGPTLLREGEVAISALEEQFRPDVTEGPAPRSAVGITEVGELLLVAVDGRQPRLSRGLSLPGLAYLLKQQGAVEGINLDGGGSTAMAIGGRTVNTPSDGRERPVNSALLVFSGPGQISAR